MQYDDKESSPNPIVAFVSYASEDEKLFSRFETHLSALKRQKLLTIWHPSLTPAGINLAEERTQNLLASQIIIVLLSSDYVASGLCMDLDTRLAFQLQQAGKTRVVPVRLRDVDVSGTPYEPVCILPSDGSAIVGGSRRGKDQSTLLRSITDSIRETVSSLHQKLYSASNISAETESGQSQSEVDICPYLGLQPYTEADMDFFFGREEYIHELRVLLRNNDERLLAILGPTGSGKTSVVQAGLFPLLRDEYSLQSDNAWEFFSFQPGVDPFEPLIRSGLSHANRDLVTGIQYWLREHPNYKRLVLYIDQFEEIFRLVPKQIYHSFFDQLVRLIEQNIATVIFTMSDAYYSLLADHTSLISLVERGLSNIPPVHSNVISSIIERPATLAHLHFEKGLVRTITEDTLHSTKEPKEQRAQRSSSILPLLSFCLKQLYDHRNGQMIRYEDLDSIGGVTGAITEWATKTYNELSPRQQLLARRVFIELVEVGDDSRGRLDCRRKKTLAALIYTPEEAEDIRNVVEAFAQAHVLETIFDDSLKDIQITIIHEVILREWKLLQEWLRADHRFYLWHQELEQIIQYWVQNHIDPHQRDVGYLLRGQPLLEAEGWFRERKKELSGIEQTFIEMSIEQRAYEVHQREIMEKMKRKQQMTIAKQIATRALLLQANEHRLLQTSLLLAVEAIRRYPCEEADAALRQGLQLLPPLLVRFPLASGSFAFFSRDGERLVAVGESEVVWMHHINFYGQDLQRLAIKNAQTVAFSANKEYMLIGVTGGIGMLVNITEKKCITTIRYSSDTPSIRSTKTGSFLMVSADNSSIDEWDISHLPTDEQQEQYTLVQTSTLNTHHLRTFKYIIAIALSHDEQYIATADNNGMIVVWERRSGKNQTKYHGKTSIQSLAFSRDDLLLVGADDENSVVIWRWRSSTHRQKEITYLTHPAKVTYFSCSSDGCFLTTLCADKKVRVWTFSRENNVYLLPHGAPVHTISSCEDSNMVATISIDGTVKIWDVAHATLLYCINHAKNVKGVAFNQHKPYVATVEDNGYVNIWELRGRSDCMKIEHRGNVQHFAFSQYVDQHQLNVAIQEENNLKIFLMNMAHRSSMQVYTYSELLGFAFAPDGKRFRPPTKKTHKSIFSPCGNYIARVKDNRAIDIMNTFDQQIVSSFDKLLAVDILVFSPDEKYLAIVDTQHTISIWDWKLNVQVPLTMLKHNGPVCTLSFNANAEYLIFTGNGDCAYIWQWQIRHEQSTYALKHEGDVRSIELSPDGRYLLTASSDKKARIWDVMTGVPISVFSHKDEVVYATFSRDGRYVATASSDKMTGVWETVTGNCLARLQHEGKVCAVTFSGDNVQLATATDEPSIYIWQLDLENLIADVKARLTGNLTREEWQEYLGNEPYHRTFYDLGWREIPPNDPFL